MTGATKANCSKEGGGWHWKGGLPATGTIEESTCITLQELPASDEIAARTSVNIGLTVIKPVEDKVMDSIVGCPSHPPGSLMASLGGGYRLYLAERKCNSTAIASDLFIFIKESQLHHRLQNALHPLFPEPATPSSHNQPGRRLCGHIR
uniref:Uncharacterized protein n=1 Tax=Steinernema glaseri TaxID=37863 RepID=A0A1I7YFD3_9BILA